MDRESVGGKGKERQKEKERERERETGMWTRGNLLCKPAMHGQHWQVLLLELLLTVTVI